MSDSKPPPLALRALVAIGAGAILHILAPPINLHWLHWLAYLPMFWVVRPDTPKANAWLGYLYGAVGVGLIFRWFVDTIILFSNLSPVLAYTCLVLFSAAFGIPYALLWWSVHKLRARVGVWWVLALPALEVLIEFASMFILLFPYQHGVSQYRFPYTWQLASVTGVWGLSFLVFFVNATLAEAIYRHREGGRFPILAVCGSLSTLFSVVLFGAWRHAKVEAVLADAPVIRAAQLQSGQGMKERFGLTAREAFRYWVEATQSLEGEDPDLVVWSEGACPYNLNEGRVPAVLQSLASKGDFELIVGAGSRERRVEEDGEKRVTAFNSVYYFSPDDTKPQRYDKMVPLPFGEYIPFSGTFPWLADLIQGPGNFGAGKTAVTFEGDGRTYGSPICYEAILSYVVRRWDNPDLLVNVTNDAWFGDTAAPHQHAMLAAVRSIELGTPTFRAAYSGVSMVIEPHGRIHSETRPFTEVHRVVPVRVATVPTIYSKLGDWFVYLCGIGFAAGLIATRRRDDDSTQGS